MSIYSTSNEETWKGGVCKVGYALSAKKMRKRCIPNSCDGDPSAWAGGGLADIVSDDSVVIEGVQFSSIKVGIPATNQCRFDVIIHKLTDVEKEDNKRKVEALNDYLSLYPSTVVLDPLPAVHTVLSRQRTCERLRSIEQSFASKGTRCPFSQPNFVIVQHASELVEAMERAGIHFPVICKPIDACGTANSHVMVVLVSEKDVSLVTFPALVQQYCNHDEQFYKVYVLDSDVMVYKRKSLPNLSTLSQSKLCGSSNNKRARLADGTSSSSSSLASTTVSASSSSSSSSSSLRSVVFDSRQSYPTLENFQLRDGAAALIDSSARQSSQQLFEPPSLQRRTTGSPLQEDAYVRLREKFENAAAAIRQEFGLTLFGFDVIIPTNLSSADGIVVIDVNFFPSYKEVADFTSRLRSLLRRKGGFAPFEFDESKPACS